MSLNEIINPTAPLDIKVSNITSTGIILPSTGTPASLNYYEEFKFDSTTTGAWASANITIYFTRIGPIVNATTKVDVSDSISVQEVGVTLVDAFPARFRPAGNTQFYTLLEDGGLNVNGTCLVGLDGSMSWTTDNDGFTGDDAAIRPFSYTWRV